VLGVYDGEDARSYVRLMGVKRKCCKRDQFDAIDR
jgi:hypothetical protein